MFQRTIDSLISWKVCLGLGLLLVGSLFLVQWRDENPDRFHGDGLNQIIFDDYTLRVKLEDAANPGELLVESEIRVLPISLTIVPPLSLGAGLVLLALMSLLRSRSLLYSTVRFLSFLFCGNATGICGSIYVVLAIVEPDLDIEPGLGFLLLWSVSAFASVLSGYVVLKDHEYGSERKLLGSG